MSNHVRSLLRTATFVLAVTIGSTACGQPELSRSAGSTNAPLLGETGNLDHVAEETISPIPSSVSMTRGEMTMTRTPTSVPEQTAEPVASTPPLSFGDVPLPSIRSVNAPEGDVASGQVPLPHAWLIVRGRAFPATFGSFTWPVSTTNALQEIRHGDAIEPEWMPWLATAILGADEQAAIIIDAQSVKQVEPHVRPWSQEPSYAPFTPLLSFGSVERNGVVTIVRLSSLKDASDRLLYVPVTFGQGDVAYYWRLNPDR